MLKYLIVLASALMCLNSYAVNYQPVYESSVSIYNKMKTGGDLIDFVFAFDQKHTTEDKSFIKNLKENLQNTPLPKATISGDAIFIDGNKIEIVKGAVGNLLINGKNVKFSPLKPLVVTFKDIENVMNSKHSKFELFFGNKAYAVGSLVVAAAAVYGVGAIVTGGSCALLGVGFGGTSTETLKKTARLCSELAVAWPYAAWSFYDDIKNSHEIKSGSCEKSGPFNKFGNLVKLRTRDDIGKRYLEKSEIELELYKKEYYFKTDEKTGKVHIFTIGYDSKNNTYDQVHEQDEKYNSIYLGNDEQAASKYIKSLEEVCVNGDSAVLDKLIKSDKSVSFGLINLVKVSDQKYQAEQDKTKKKPAAAAVSK